MNKAKLLIVDDDESIRTQLKYALRDEYATAVAEDRQQAVQAAREMQPAVVTLDLGLPPAADTAEEGLKALDEILREAPASKVVVITGNTDRHNAIHAVGLGAFDYQLKPIDLEQLRVVLRRACYLQGVEAEGDALRQAEESAARFEDILGTTARMREIFNTVQRVAKTDVTALIMGESGTGKELVAKAIHTRSARRHGPYIPINCGAIPETLLESELFGHEKGSFTGAHVQRKGKIEMADRGTLFLDEIGELSPALQVKLLRFLQDRTVERIGGRQPIHVDLRVIAATNRDLRRQLDTGAFREDLFYRLSVVSIHLPPLRERGEDIVLLAHAFLERTAREQRRRRIRFGTEAMRALMAHNWPGNVRELENKVSRAVIMARGPVIEPADLDLAPAPASPVSSLRGARDRVERESLVDMLTRHRGNVSQAARELQVSRPTIHGLLQKHRLNAKDFR